jgi:uncharacterized protein YndB with AHSA1/START domain
MTNATETKRIDSASRVIKTSPLTIYHAFLDADAVASWRPPKGMKCEVYEFEPRQGGSYRMSFSYKDTDHEVPGKTSEHADVFRGRFLELVPGKRIVESVEFESDDPDFAGEMTITTILDPVPGGTMVTFLAGSIPVGIKPADHYKGMTSTLENLAAFTE